MNKNAWNWNASENHLCFHFHLCVKVKITCALCAFEKLFTLSLCKLLGNLSYRGKNMFVTLNHREEILNRHQYPLHRSLPQLNQLGRYLLPLCMCCSFNALTLLGGWQEDCGKIVHQKVLWEVYGRLGGRVVGKLDLRSTGRGFESRLPSATLGKLFTHMCLCRQAV